MSGTESPGSTSKAKNEKFAKEMGISLKKMTDELMSCWIPFFMSSEERTLVNDVARSKKISSRRLLHDEFRRVFDSNVRPSLEKESEKIIKDSVKEMTTEEREKKKKVLLLQSEKLNRLLKEMEKK